jgi:DOPA 4,5-dioxygenase
LRDRLSEAFAVELGRWHDAPVGPHPCGSYQIAFAPQLFATLVPWLALNRGDLTVFVHPNTGDALADHTTHVMWLGESRALNLAALR